MAENPRIEELRRRIQKDPASIAFAQLAEEYRRAGNYEEAIAICRQGLQTHPSYLSARVTLGRALIEIHELEKAEPELRYVLQNAPENLAAIRAIAEIHHRRGELSEALGFYRSALELARHDPDLEQTVDEIARAVSKPPAPAVEPERPAPSPLPASTRKQTTAEFLASTFDLLELDPEDLEPETAAPAFAATEDKSDALPHPEPAETLAHSEPAGVAEPVEDADYTALLREFDQAEMPAIPHPALPGLQRFLEAIHSYRQRRAV